MSYSEWKDKTAAFKQIDVRGVQGNFFQGKERREICVALKEKFGEKNPDVKV